MEASERGQGGQGSLPERQPSFDCILPSVQDTLLSTPKPEASCQGTIRRMWE
jgi:hypothetical protein